MNRIKYIREIGYIYDLIYIFKFRFNKKYCLDKYVNRSNESDDKEFFNASMYEYHDYISDKLNIFFLINNKKCFFTNYYFNHHKNKFPSEYSYTYLQNMLFHSDELIDNMYSWYFDTTDTNRDLSHISALIYNSQYDDGIKNSLYYFFINPIETIRELNTQLSLISSYLMKNYEKRYQVQLYFQNNLEYKSLQDSVKKLYNYQLSEYQNIYVSSCLLAKNTFRVYPIQNDIFIILGYDYENMIINLLSTQNDIVLYEIGNVLSEKNRVEILNLVLEMGEITMRTLEKELKLSGSNAYYHITMMLKIGLLKSRSQGRIIFYSINESKFASIINALKKYCAK